MSTIIHEGAHKYLGMFSDVYYTTPGCSESSATKALSDAERLRNADSYACLVHALG